MSINVKKIRIFAILFISLVVVTGVFFVAQKIDKRADVLDNNNFRGFDGEGSEENPFKLSSKEELKNLEEAVCNGEFYSSAIYELISDIDMEGESLRIGIDEDTCFKGVLYGNGYSISGINSILPGEEAGLFAGLRGRVYNLCVTDSYFEGRVAGGIASSARGGYIMNCVSNATVSGTELEGTIIGDDIGYIINCVSQTAGEPIGHLDPYGYYNLVYGNNGKEYISKKDNECVDDNEILSVLNDNIGKIDSEYPVRLWTNDDILRPNGNELVRYDAAYTYVNLAGKTRKLTGFFADDYGMWSFCIPRGCKDEVIEVVLSGENGVHHEKIKREEGQVSFSEGGTVYGIQIVEYDDAPSLFVDINRKDGLEYIYATKDNEVEATITEVSPEGRIVDKIAVDAVGCRGNSSFVPKLTNKNSFKLDFKNRVSLCGMPENDNYVLLAGFRETSILSYQVEMGISKAVNIPYVPDTRLVNVFINDNYLGAYILSGAQEIDEGRFELKDIMAETALVNAGELKNYPQIKEGEDLEAGCRVYYDIPNNPEDITGDYLIEIDTGDYPDSRSRFVSNANISLALKGANYASKEELYYIADFWQDFEDALFSDDGYNSKGKYYADYIDLTSLADISLAFEISEDASMHGSIYFYKESDITGDGKLHASYHWDCEHSFMVTDKLYTEKYLENSRRMRRVEESAPLWLNIYKHEDAYALIRSEYKDKYEPVLDNILADNDYHNPDGESSIEYFRNTYKKSGYANSCRWINSSYEKKADDIKYFLTERKGVLDKWLLQ